MEHEDLIVSMKGIQKSFGGVHALTDGELTSDGLDLDRTNGKYKDLIVIGFDSGSTLNNAVRSGYFYGAVAQDPYTMGYEAMMMAINVLQGGEASDIVIPAVWFDASNMDDPEISRILYD